MSQYIVKARKTYLKSPLTTSASSIVLREFVDSKGNELALSDFGAYGVIVIKQGDTIEMIKFDGVTQDGSSTTCTLTVATNGRNLDPTTPYAGASTGSAFQSGAECIVTNDPLTVSQFGNLNNANTWTLLQTFTVMPQSTAVPSAGADLINKNYADALVLGTLTTLNVIVPATAGATITAGQLVYFDTVTANEWLPCDADTATTVENVMLGIAQGAGTDGTAITGGVLLRGVDTNQTGMTAGDIMYASNTAGAISSSAGTNEVAIGVAKSATDLYFNPRFNQTLTEDQIDALAGTSGTPSSTNKFVTNDDTATSGANKVLRLDGTGKLPALDGSNLTNVVRFGGDGSDGALAITTGTTDIDCGGERVVVKDYTSISITGDGALTFSNPHASGTFVFLRSQGDVTLTSTATPMIDMSGMGASGATALGIGATSAGNSGTDGTSIFTTTHKGVGASTINYGDGGAIASFTLSSVASSLLQLYSQAFVGAGGGGGNRVDTGIGECDGGGGGRGGGALIIECKGAWNFTTASGISVAGDNGTSPTTDGAQAGGGGGGGGAGGFFLALYNTLTANTGTVTVSGGSGATALNSGGIGDVSGGGGAGSPVSAGTRGNQHTADGNGNGGAGANGLSTVAQNLTI